MRVLALLVVVAAATIRAAPEPRPTAAVLKRQDLPPCVQACLPPAASASGCSLADFNCLCNTASFLQMTADCFASQCSDQAALYGLQFGQQACDQVGVSESIPPEASSVLATKTTAGTSGAFDTTFVPAASSSAPGAGSTSAPPSSTSTSTSPSASARDSSSSLLSPSRLLVAVAVAVLLLLAA